MWSSSLVLRRWCLKNWRNTWHSTRIDCERSMRAWKSWRMLRRSLVWWFVIPSRVTQDLEDTRIPWMLMRSILFHPIKETGHRVHEMVVSSVVEHTFNETAMHAKATVSNYLARAHRASHAWSKSEGKGKSEENKGKSKGQSKGTKGAKGSAQGLNIENWSLRSWKLEEPEGSSDTQESA